MGIQIVVSEFRSWVLTLSVWASAGGIRCRTAGPIKSRLSFFFFCTLFFSSPSRFVLKWWLAGGGGGFPLIINQSKCEGNKQCAGSVFGVLHLESLNWTFRMSNIGLHFLQNVSLKLVALEQFKVWTVLTGLGPHFGPGGFASCIAGHCYYQLSVFLFLSPSFAYDPILA